MDGNQLKKARLARGWTQKEAAHSLDVTQAYLSMLEKGYRPLLEPFVGKALKVLHLSPTALPLQSEAMAMPASSRKRDFSRDLGALGYPGFSYLPARTRRNPAQVLFEALNQPNLDARVAEGLPWLVLTYGDMDWSWLVRNAKVYDRQNRLGFAVSLAKEVAEHQREGARASELRQRLKDLEGARLVREDTFCHDSMSQAERVWLREHRPPAAAHWNLLTDMKRERLAYTSK